MLNVFANILFRIFRLILAFLHFAYSGIEYFDLVKCLVRRKLKEIVLRVQGCDTEFFVSNFVKQLKKCPTHFVVVVGKEGITFEDFSNIVIWCLAAKITFLSFYDYTGYLKTNQNIYYKYLISKGKLNPNSLSFGLEKKDQKNGITHRIHLNVLSLDDGKPLFVQLTKDLSQKVASNELTVTDINEQLINQKLFESSGLPDPDLTVICGPICSSFGLLPWQIKVTEFLQVESFKEFQVTDFTTVLEKYSSCNQRFGK